MLAEVHSRWRGESTAFLTGWEAGGHTVWAQALRHPEHWCGVALVSPNYQRRGLQPAAFSHRPERASLPIQVFRCGAPTGEAIRALQYVDQQTATALEDSRGHGFQARPVRVIPGVEHGPLPEAVLAWCDSIRGRAAGDSAR